MSRFVTPAFLRSPEYTRLMRSRVPHGEDPGTSEMEVRTPSAVLRHADIAGLLGVWRWRGIERHAGAILRELEEREAVLDFGGAGGPLGLGSVVVDLAERDVYGDPVRLHSLDDARYEPLPAPSVTCVFASHVLEHIADLDGVLAQIRDAIAPGGLLIAHVPAWTCVRWRAGIHTSPDFAPHVWDFGLTAEAPIPGLKAYTSVVARIAAAGLAVELAEHCGDDSIMVMARRVA